MKSLLRWSAALGLMGGVMLTTLQVGIQRAFALTDEQVMEQLRGVPVFMLTDQRGAPLEARAEGQDQSVTGVFISQQDAANFLTSLRQNNPQLGQSVQVSPVSLAEVYQLARRSEDSDLRFQFVPMQPQVQTAVTLLQQSGQNVQEFNSVPLFMARLSNEGDRYLSIQQGEQAAVLLFFKREDLQATIDRLQQEQPDVASQMTIQVTSLEGIIEQLRESEDAAASQILLVPPRESIDYIRQLQPQQGQPQPQPQQ
ncbi:Tic22 family protein [Microcoleus sp. FACHB-1515]|uniref:Tic22 family protein n=1 Tax=Cyanophyceae TaxID=3028117 RepID=UPI001F5524BB|nr:Tic22 family protein [Microcoleus sp. FACHB-1515]